MSEHFVHQDEPPPGISSFTKIRLGWITNEQAIFVRPGEDAYGFLSPLSQGGEKLVVKINFSDGKYYLIENRQQPGYDKNLPDSGIIVLRVNPQAQEGHGTVEVMDANPYAPHFSQAAYNLSDEKRNLFKDNMTDIAVIPLWRDGDKTGVLITTIEKSGDALKAAVAIQQLLSKGKNTQLLTDSIEAFKKFDFKASWQMSQKKP
ncbi:MAG: hypothetical protein HY806_06445 [Nitrospirae bacterium]|nr:hypothetical protein [Nitrospirota bacterium]